MIVNKKIKKQSSFLHGMYVVLLLPFAILGLPLGFCLNSLRERRILAMLHKTNCPACGKVLEKEARHLANEAWRSHVEEMKRKSPHARLRLVRTLDVLCPHCSTRFRLDGNNLIHDPVHQG